VTKQLEGVEPVQQEAGLLPVGVGLVLVVAVDGPVRVKAAVMDKYK
jgi:hypothetical protein